MQSRNISYIGALDQLRGFAALQILVYHAFLFISYQQVYAEPFTTAHWLKTQNPLSALLVEGHTAVALFMVMSGFIFTIGTHAHEIDYRNFIVNRLLRTFPLFIVMIFAAMAVNPDKSNLYSVLLTITTFSTHPDAVHGGPFSMMFWAISVEWQFYLIFPFLIIMMRRDGIKAALGLILLLIIFRWLLTEFGASALGISYSTIWGRLDQFLIGMIAGYFYVTAFRKGVGFDLLALVSAGGLVAYLFIFNQMGGYPADAAWKIITPTIEGLLWGGFILGYLSLSRWLPGFVSAPLQAVGLISYSIYLIHMTVVDWVVRNNVVIDYFGLGPAGNSLVTIVVLVLPAALLLSTLTYNLIEKPFLSMRRTYKLKRVTGFAEGSTPDSMEHTPLPRRASLHE